MALALAPATAAIAADLPTGGQIVMGQGSIGRPEGSSLDIHQGSDKLAIQWQEFNIGEGHRVSFHQPGADSIALNRVIGADGSQILGQIDANGRVFLINPNGILFGRNAQVDVGGLVASTLDISNEDFAAGRYQFRGNGTPGAVENHGRISASDGGAVALLGGRVSNQGLVSARRGTVALAAGNAVTLDFAGDGLLNVQVDEATRDALVENHQLIQADGGQVLMTAKASDALLQTVVNNTGVIEARTLENRNGKIVLLGGFEGGTVQVAGTLDASAPQRGDGGFIDTSGAHVQVADGTVVTTASAYGRTGEWLIDPTDFTIADGSGALTSSGIGAATLSANLANTSVTLATVASGGGEGNIHVNAAVAWNAPTTLTLNAHQDIFINAPITIAHTGGGLALNHGNYANTHIVNGSSDYHVNASVSFTAGSGGYFAVNGTEYTLIHTRAQLENIVVDQPDDWDWDLAEWEGNAYALARDLDLSDVTYGNVVVTGTKDRDIDAGIGAPPPLTGVILSGLGHSISNLTIDGSGSDSYSYGLFGRIGIGVLRDLTLQNSRITGNANHFGGTGALFGAIASKADISNVTLFNTTVQGANYVGGIVGRIDLNAADTGIRDTRVNDGTVTGNDYVGGLVGYFTGVASGNASGARVGGNGYVGGLLGYLDAYGRLFDSYSFGNVQGANNTGGLVGATGTGSLIGNTSATGNVNGTNYTGGLVGSNAGTIEDSFANGTVDGASSTGGLVGTHNSGSIDRSHATGTVTATDQNTGGLVGYSISDINDSYASGTVTGLDYVGGLVGLNGWAGGRISNSQASGEVQGGMFVGGLVGAHQGVARDDIDTYIKQSSAHGTVTGTQFVGGLVGDTGAGSRIENSSASGDVHGESWVGGLIGRLSANGSVTDSYAIGDVDGADYVGGLIGTSTGSETTPNTIEHTFATGNVVGSHYVGGLVGYNDTYSRISGSYAQGSVQGVESVGGLVGMNSGNSAVSESYAIGDVKGWRFVGGLVGYNSDATIYQTYATGQVSAIDDPGTPGGFFGGLLGYGNGSIVTGSFWNTETSGQSNGIGNGDQTGVQGLTSAQMRRLDPFIAAGWNIDDMGGTGNAWRLYTGYTAPLLRHFMKPLTVTVDGNKVYDGLTSGTLTNYQTDPEDVIWALILGSLNYQTSSRNAGHYYTADGTLVLSGLYSLQQGYDISYAPGHLSIDKRSISVNADPNGKIYGDADPELTWSVGGLGLAEGDTLASVLSGQLTRENGENAGQYIIYQGSLILLDPNYELLYVGNDFTITPRGITITADDLGKLYGNADPTLTWRITDGSLLGNDTLSGTLARETGENVGGYAIGRGTLTNGNYDITFVDGLFTITPRDITVTADHLEKIYGDADPTLTWTVTDGNLVAGDTLNGALSRQAGENVGSYGIGQGTLYNDNYSITFIDGAMSITQRLIHITADSLDKIYGDADPTLTWTVGGLGLANGDSNDTVFSGALLREAGEDTGTYGISQGSLALINGNYQLDGFTPGVFTITPRGIAITVTADNLSKIYGDRDPEFTWQLTDGALLEGDILSGSLVRDAGENVGQYGIHQGTLAHHNYNITFIDGVFTITPRSITITADDLEKIYGNADPTLSWRITDGRLVEGDTFAGTLSRQTGENVGQYAIGQGSLANGNYDIRFVDGVLSITPRSITITADDLEKIYGNADPTLTWAITDGSLVGDDTLTGALSRQAGENVGSYAIGQGNLVDASGNYSLSFVDGVLSITPRGITITADDLSKIYGDADPTLTWTITDGSLVEGDALAGALSRQTGENVGSYVINRGSLANGNYDIRFVDGVLSITPRAITVLIDSKQKVYGDVDPELTWSVVQGNLVNGDTLQGTPTRQAGENVGYYDLLLGTLGDSSGNYDVTFQAGQLEITKRLLHIVADDKSKIYGDDDPIFTWSVTQGELVNGDTLNGTITRQAGEAVWHYNIDPSGLTNGNYDIVFGLGRLWINPRPITITADDLGKIYGDDDPVFTWRITDGNLVDGDALYGTPERQTGENVGQYAIGSGTLGNGGPYNGNYAITFVDGAFSITPRSITVTADDLEKIYGNADPTLTWRITDGNLVDGDTFDGTLARQDGENVGQYGIGLGSLGNGNYDIRFVDGMLSITPRHISITADDLEKIYGDADPFLSYTVGGMGIASWDTLAAVLSGALQRASGENVGHYVIDRGSLGANANYVVDAFSSGVLTVTPRSLVVSAEDLEKWFGDADPALSWRITQGDLASWDSLASVFSGNLARQVGEDVGQYVIHQGDLAGSSNYRIEFQNGRFMIREVVAPVPEPTLTVSADILASPYSPHCQASEFSGESGGGCIVPDEIDQSPYRIINGGMRLP